LLGCGNGWLEGVCIGVIGPIGEPPATKGYPPSVFAKLPALVERAGNDATGRGSITAFYTVLTEGDDLQDPVADSARAILDGHVVLSRQLADEGHYPAIDMEASISRAMRASSKPSCFHSRRRSAFNSAGRAEDRAISSSVKMISRIFSRNQGS